MTTVDHSQRQMQSSVVDAAGWVIKKIASYGTWFLARGTSAALAALCSLDPRVHFERLRIKSTLRGRLSKNNDKFALLVLYSQQSLPEFTQTFIDAVARSELDLVLVSNGSLDDATKTALLDRCCLLIERTNVGRDFGAYKDGISAILNRFPRVRRLVLANDSVFYLPNGLDDVIAQLADGGDFIGVSEVFEHHYHVASFLLSFGPAVIGSDAFRRFWRRYLPISSRRWSVLRGEGELTRQLLIAGFQPRVLYRTQALRERLQQCPIDRLLRDMQALPVPARSRLLQKWRGQNLSASAENAALIADDIANAIRDRNQMHHGGFLFRRYFGLPIVKRDLVYRNVYSLPDVLANLGDVDAPLREAISADFRARPLPENLGPWRRTLHRHGTI